MRAVKAGVNAKEDKNKTVQKNAVDAAKLLMEAGANVNAKNNDGKTALMKAKEHDSVDVVKLLEDAGAR